MKNLFGFNPHGLRFKLSVVLSVFAFLPALILGIWLIWSNNQSLVENGIQTAKQQFSLSAASVRMLMQSAESTAAALAKDQTLQQAHTGLARPNTTMSEAIDIYLKLDKLLRYFDVSNNLSGIRLYLPDYDGITSQEWSVFGLSALQAEALPPEIAAGSSVSGWAAPQSIRENTQRMLTYFYRLISYQEYTPKSSMICVDMAESRLLDCFPDNPSQETYFCLLDSGENIVLQSGGEAVFPGKVPPENEALVNTDALGSCFYQSQQLPESGWTLCMLVPLSQFQGRESTLLLWYILALVCVFSVILVCAHTVAGRLVSELWELTEKCRMVKEGVYGFSSARSSTVEIQTLQNTFNDMVGRMDSLINDVCRERLLKQETKVALLYEQMKPHFLYNTLESAKWVALRGGSPQVAKYMEELSRFFRLTLSQGEDWVPLEQEISLANTYVSIMNTRFHDSIQLVQRVEPAVLQEPVLRLILQPFLENAVLHGIFEKESRTGIVEISVGEGAGNLELTISDDGSGMDEAHYDRLNQCEKLGFGIANVRERLGLYYGEDSRVIFSRNEWGGTLVKIQLPYKKK